MRKDCLCAKHHLEDASAVLEISSVVSSELILPFTVNIIPLNKEDESLAPETSSPTTTSTGTSKTDATAATPSRASSALPSLPKPHKPVTPLVQMKCEDFNLLKKSYLMLRNTILLKLKTIL